MFLTGRQLIRVEQKNQKVFDARIYAKMWLSANTIPNSSDQTDASRRVVYQC
jgi:phage/plasmid-associated DNA primase